ncbi:thioesterase II family protein [Streptomyces sp. NPDC090108]|uniref:thioesterase II family protein n=1 Tax=Streptomyces sp. NPDC090108 TaxID=3365947 RepID=UPI003807BFAD
MSPDLRARRSTAGWLRPAGSDPDARAALFLFHYSGGGVSMYSRWPGFLPPSVECRRVQLPGRQDRLEELAFTELAPLVTALCEVISRELDGRPYALFGHSMGALLAYRVAVAMEARGPRPALLGVSGWAPEGFSMPGRALVEGPAEGIVALLRELGTLPGGDLDPELSARVVASMRADLAVCAGYRDDRARVGCPLVAYGGRDDPYLAPGALRSWASRGDGFLGVREFPGGHFFIHDHGPGIAMDLVQLLHRHIAG